MFPVEIWEEILPHMDAVTLTKWRLVCSDFNWLIDKILKRTQRWQQSCFDDIPDDVRLIILEKNEEGHRLYSDAANSDKPEVWLGIYKSWRGWNRFDNGNLSTSILEPLPEHRMHERINCIAAMFNYVAIGTSEGYVIFYDFAAEKILFRADQKFAVKDVRLWRHNHNIKAVSSNFFDNLGFFDVTSGKITCKNQGSMIRTSFECCCYIYGSSMTLIKGNKRNFVDTRALKHCKAMGINGNQMLFLEQADNKLLSFSATFNPSDGLVYSHENDKRLSLQPKGSLMRYQIFMPSIIACIGGDGEFGFYIHDSRFRRKREWKMYDLFYKLAARVSAIFVHVGTLVLGTESGEVHIFTIEDRNALESLDFENMKSRKIVLDSTPIVALNATEHGNALYIIAASARKVHFIKRTS